MPSNIPFIYVYPYDSGLELLLTILVIDCSGPRWFVRKIIYDCVQWYLKIQAHAHPVDILFLPTLVRHSHRLFA